jgi:macrolide transport system ATP-binding/permease protein
MDAKEKPKWIPSIRLDFSLTDPPANKIVLSGDGIDFSYGDNIIFENASFAVKNGARIAICGENGSGKTTLMNLMYRGGEQFYRVPKARIGYFYQGFENIDRGKTVLQNVMGEGVQNETIVRSVLSRLLFGPDDIGKPAGVLSGGERIKLGLAKLLVSRNNILMLDEPTNYLDMPSIETLQNILIDYEGTLLFVSHDREFLNAVCTEILLIQDKKIYMHDGSLSDYEARPSLKT